MIRTLSALEVVCTVVLRSGVHCEFMFHYWSWTDGEGGRGVEGMGGERGDGRGGNEDEKWEGQGKYGDVREERDRGGEGSVRWMWEGKRQRGEEWRGGKGKEENEKCKEHYYPLGWSSRIA